VQTTRLLCQNKYLTAVTNTVIKLIINSSIKL